MVSVRRGTCSRLDEGEGVGLLSVVFSFPPPTTTTMGAAVKIHLLYREGFARFAVRCQHKVPRGSSPPTRPTRHLDSSNQSSLKGHSPALSATSGAWDPCGAS